MKRLSDDYGFGLVFVLGIGSVREFVRLYARAGPVASEIRRNAESIKITRVPWNSQHRNKEYRVSSIGGSDDDGQAKDSKVK